MSADPFGRALYDHHTGNRDEPLIQRDGEEALEHPIQQFYFEEFTGDESWAGFFQSYLDGPLLDIGAGAGRHPLYFQEAFETVAIEVSEHLVTVMDERGVTDARLGDMFELPAQFERDQFQSAMAFGTQLGLAHSMDNLRSFLSDLARITKPDGTALLDSTDPTRDGTQDLLGYRSDPTPGLAYRVMTFEYEGDVGDILLFRLYSPDRLREATIGTPWEVADVRYGSEGSGHHYVAALSKA
jgi:SAM-dependent methyltransferase